MISIYKRPAGMTGLSGERRGKERGFIDYAVLISQGFVERVSILGETAPPRRVTPIGLPPIL